MVQLSVNHVDALKAEVRINHAIPLVNVIVKKIFKGKNVKLVRKDMKDQIVQAVC